MNFRIATLAAAALIATGALSTAQAGVSAATQTKLTTSSLIDLGVAQADALHNFSITLPLRDPAGANAFVASTVDPASPNFRQFLTPQQFTAAYGPTADSVAQVTAFLAANGIAVTSVSDNRIVIKAQATNAQLSSLFGASIHAYSNNGRVFVRPVSAATLPAGLAGVVSGVVGLSTQPLSHSNVKYSPRASSVPQGFTASDASPDATANASPGQYSQVDLLKTYKGTATSTAYTGKNLTMGILTFAGFDKTDATYYWNNVVGLKNKTLANRITEVSVNGYVGSINDDGSDETTLDVEQSGALAPMAKILVYEAANDDQGSLDLYTKAIGDNLCDTMSVSWGLAEIEQNPAQFAAYDALFTQAAAQGTPIMASSGDAGAFDINRSTFVYPTFTQILTVDFPASHPKVLAAGGTTLPVKFTSNATGAVVANVPAERPWAWDYFRDYVVSTTGQADYYTTYFPVGGGGGVSVQYPLPDYQQGLAGTKVSNIAQTMFGPANYNATTNTFSGPMVSYASLAANYAGRNVPDVSLDADPETGYLLYYAGNYGGGLYTDGGGTSFVAPQLNGIFNLITQRAGKRLGQLQPQLYRSFKSLGYGATSPFRALTTGTNLYYTAGNNYNPASGLGVLNIDNLAAALAPAN